METDIVPVEPTKANLPLIREAESKDPFAVARVLVDILNSEIERYDMARGAERTILQKTGLMNPHITDLAKAILAGGKTINDINNPPQKFIPPGGNYQQNNFFISPGKAAAQIESMPEEEREKAINIIDALLEHGEQTERVPENSLQGATARS